MRSGNYYRYKEARRVNLTYRIGADDLQLRGEVPHGAGTRDITLTLRPEEIVGMARYLAPVLTDPDPGARGHAFWHYERQDREYPCSGCPAYVQDALTRTLVSRQPSQLPESKNAQPAAVEVVDAELVDRCYKRAECAGKAGHEGPCHT